MSCPLQLSGLSLGCNDVVGGISEVYIIDRNLVTGVTASGSTITAINTGVEKFKVYKFKKQTGMLNSVGAFADANENVIWTNDLTLKFNKLEATKRTEILNLAKGSLAVIVKTAGTTPTYKYLGFDNEVTMSAATASTGTAFTDQNGYNITLQEISFTEPYFVDGSIIAGLIA